MPKVDIFYVDIEKEVPSHTTNRIWKAWITQNEAYYTVKEIEEIYNPFLEVRFRPIGDCLYGLLKPNNPYKGFSIRIRKLELQVPDAKPT